MARRARVPSRRTISRVLVDANRHRQESDGATISIEAQIGRRLRVQPDGCWLYYGNADEYGRARIHGQTIQVHRFVYETLVGPIPSGEHLHHRCHRPGCCNPAHLEPLTPKAHSAEHRVSA